MKSGHFKSFDNSEIFYREWNYQPHQKSIIMIHRGMSILKGLMILQNHPNFQNTIFLPLTLEATVIRKLPPHLCSWIM